MASVSMQPGGQRRILFYDAHGKRLALRIGKADDNAADLIKGHVEEIVRCQLSRDTPKRATSEWLGELGSSMRDKLARVGLIAFIEEAGEVAAQVKPKVATLGPFLDA